jgi:RNA 2',3'-cyclic 3'-phosphodiesterase
MRFFIALEIPNENLASFQAIQAKLHTLIPQARLTDLEKIHLTLAFVGEQDNTLKEDLIEVIKNAASSILAFEVSPGYIDCFPDLHHPEIFWVGVKGDVDKIFLIREKIKDGLEDLKLPIDERRFVPHITIAKINNHLEVGRNLEANLEEITNRPFDPISISSIKLFESIPQEGFHRHNALAEIFLR